jgi:hypothetical protein
MAKGGSRYGAGRPGYRVVGETLQRIDVRLWSRKGYLQGDTEHSFSWHWTRNDKPSGSIGVQANGARVILSYRLQANGDDWRDRWETVAIEQTMCRFGGVRNWFQCPHCVRRCELLYLRFGRFACRHCNRISYGSQSGGRYDRLLHKFHKLQKRIDCGRPKGMHHRTWEQMVERVWDLETTVDSLLGARIAHLYFAAGLDPNEALERGL